MRNSSTILVLHSGNHEIIGVRHRRTQTLYISDVIEPHSCTPAYGKIQVGIYIAAILDALDRAKQDKEAEEKKHTQIAPVAGPQEDGETGRDDDPDESDDPDKQRKPPRPGRRGRGGKTASRTRHGKQGTRPEDQASGNQASF